MAIRFTTTVDGSILLVTASGFDESLDQVQAYGMGVIGACLESGVTHVLCDERDLEYRLSTVDTYLAGEFISSRAPAVAKVALVCDPKSIADARFWEDVVVNRGLRVRVFTDRDAAAAWLRGTG